MADLKAYTSVYKFPYPLAGDSVQNTYERIQELAERIEATYVTLGIDLSASAALMQVGDAAGGDLTGTYPNPTITTSAVTTPKILNSAVTTAKINDAAVTTAKINNFAVTTDKLDVVALKDGSTATTQSILGTADNRVATLQYVANALSGGLLAEGSVDTNELADGAVTNAKVNAAAAIAYSKLNLADSIVNADIAAGAAIAYSKLNLTGSITEADLAFNLATQAELDAHTGATTSVHGIADTSVLATTSDVSTAQSNAESYADSAVSTHAAVTTSVHGITDTANLVYTSDSRLTDSRTPTGSAGGVLSGTYPDPGFAVDMATQAELDAHASDTTAVHGIADTSVLETTTGAQSKADAAESAANLYTDGEVSTHAGVTTSVHGISDTANLVYTSDSRLTDARTPTSHASTHIPGGSDAIDLTKIVGIGATLPTLPDSLYPAGSLFGVGSVAPYLLYRSTGSAWDQIGGAGGSSVTTSDSAPATPSDGDLWYKTSNGKTYVWYEDGSSNQWVEVGTASQLAIPLHGSDHVRGGADVIDGDRLTVDYVPTNYTRNSAASGAGNNTDLTAHLSGIDTIINNFGLIHLTTQTFSSSSAITIDNVFNSTYDNYKMIISVTGTANNQIQFYLRTSGVNNTSANYQSDRFSMVAGSLAGYDWANNGTTGAIGQHSTSVLSITSCDIFSPYAVSETILFASGTQNTNTDLRRYDWTSSFNATTQFDGIQLYPVTGTLTGKVIIYGYRN